jgi:hypothetical protein
MYPKMLRSMFLGGDDPPTQRHNEQGSYLLAILKRLITPNTSIASIECFRIASK